MSKKKLKIGVVGGGNMGRVFSTLLISLGYDVELVCRSNHRAIKIDNSYAFEVNGDFGDKSYLVPFVTSIDELTSKKDIIIFATKSFDMLERVNTCFHKLTPKGMIVTIQNVYSIDKLSGIIPPESSVCMICDFACETVGKTTNVINSNGVTLGVYNKKALARMNLLADILDEIMPVYITTDIVGFTMGRNIINGAISLLGGISGLRLNEILGIRRGRYLFCKVIEECVQVCKRFRINIIPYNFQLDYTKFCCKNINGWLYRRRIIRVLKKLNGHIKSSALHELERGERTEIRCLVDAMLCYGARAKIEMKYLKALDEILSEIESKKRRINRNVLYDEKLK